MENTNLNEVTCDSCARLYKAASKRHYCSHCDKYYYICQSCADSAPKCRFCGVPLKRKSEPQVSRARRRQLQTA